MTGRQDITNTQQVREIKEIIAKKYARYLPKNWALRRTKIYLYPKKQDYNKAAKALEDLEPKRTAKKLKRDRPNLYEYSLAQAGDQKSLHGVLRGYDLTDTYRRYGKAHIHSWGFYDPVADEIHLSKKEPNTIAHELLHSYSCLRDKKGPYSYFEKVLLPELAEAIIEHLELEVAIKYAKKHNLQSLLKKYRRTKKMRADKSPRALLYKTWIPLYDKWGGEGAVLHLLFKGWFKYDKKMKQFIPSNKFPARKDLEIYRQKLLLGPKEKKGFEIYVPKEKQFRPKKDIEIKILPRGSTFRQQDSRGWLWKNQQVAKQSLAGALAQLKSQRARMQKFHERSHLTASKAANQRLRKQSARVSTTTFPTRSGIGNKVGDKWWPTQKYGEQRSVKNTITSQRSSTNQVIQQMRQIRTRLELAREGGWVPGKISVYQGERLIYRGTKWMKKRGARASVIVWHS